MAKAVAHPPAKSAPAKPDARLPVNILMVDLVSAIYWFDEALQAGLAAQGWSEVTRIQSLVLANIAAGTHRATQLAKNLGVSRQAMSLTLTEMEARGLISVRSDAIDKRARIVDFSKQSAVIRDDAMRILNAVEAELSVRIGEKKFAALKKAMAADWGPSPVDAATSAAARKSKSRKV